MNLQLITPFNSQKAVKTMEYPKPGPSKTLISASTPVQQSKRYRADRSDESVGEKPDTKKFKAKSYKDVALDTLKLFIRKKDKLSILDEKESSKIAAQLQKYVYKTILEGQLGPKPVITGTFHTSVGLCVKCGDVATKGWLVKSLGSIFPPNSSLSLEVVDDEEIRAGIPATLLVPKPRANTRDLMQVISMLNPGINTASWRIKKTVRYEDGSTLHYLLLTKRAKEEMVKKDCKIFCGVSTATIKFREIADNIENTDDMIVEEETINND